MQFKEEVSTQFQATQNYEIHAFSDELVLYPMNEYKTDSLIILNIIGRMIYEEIISGKTLNQIAAAVSNAYVVEEAKAYEDVKSCAHLLVENKVLLETAA